MNSKILLFYLLSSFVLVVSTASVYDEPRSYPEDDDAAEVFLKRFRRIIDTKNRELISTLFGNQFIFRGCDKQYTKSDLVDAIMNSTADNTQFHIVQIGTKRVEGLIVIFAQFGFAKSLSDFKQSSFAVKMLYQKETNMLIGIIMYEEECKFPRNPLIANKPDLGDRYIREFNTVISERSSELEEWLEDGFTFNSCNEVIGKDEFIKRMTKSVYIHFHSATEVGADSLKFDVTAYGFEQETVKMQFVLNLENRRFTYGIAQSCKQIVPKQNPTQVTRQPVPTVQTQPRPTVQSQPGSTVQPQPSSPPVIASQSNAADFANKVMNKTQSVINNQDKDAFKALFDSEFIMKTCLKNLTLDKAVDFLFDHLSKDSSVNSEIHGADELVDNKIKFITTVNSVKNITVEMTIRKSDGIFLGGKMLKCGSHEITQEHGSELAASVWNSFTDAVKSRDVNKIKETLTDNFEMTTCGISTHNRDAMASNFSNLNKAGDVKFEMVDVRTTNPKVIFTVSVTTGTKTKKMQFELNNENNKIERMNDCPARFV